MMLFLKMSEDSCVIALLFLLLELPLRGNIWTAMFKTGFIICYNIFTKDKWNNVDGNRKRHSPFQRHFHKITKRHRL